MTAGDRITVKEPFEATYGMHDRQITLPAGTYEVLPGPRPNTYTLRGGPLGKKPLMRGAWITSAQLEKLRKEQ